jgi:ribosomal protein S18 acetylase RimI-like enzyme
MTAANATASLPADTAERADAAFVTHVSWVPAQTPGMLSRVEAGLVLADSGLPCDTFNIVCRARLTPNTVRAAARDAISHFARVKRPFSWWLGPADRPRELGTVLEELGLEPAETELAMALPLRALPEPGPEVAGLEVRRVRTETELETMARLAAANWTPADPHVPAFYRHAAAALLRADAPQWFYVGYLHGEPVATAEATVAGATVALFGIATLPPFRGRGIGSRMTWQPLHEARKAGCDLGVLQGAAEGIGMYRRLGFAACGEITEHKPGSRPGAA